MSESQPPAVKASSNVRRATLAAAVVLLVVLVLLIGAYLARRLVARELLVGWLETRGVRADVEFQRLEPDRVVARVAIGDPAAPEVTVERVEARFAIRGFWNHRANGVDVLDVRVMHPVVRATWKNGKLSFGSLDPVIDEFLKRPPEPDAAQPLIRIEQARARMDTDFGPIAIRGDARLQDGKLVSLVGDVAPTALRADGVRADVDGGRFRVLVVDNRVDLAADLDLARFAAPDARGEGVKLTLTGEAPYPDLKTQKGDGVFAMKVEGNAKSFAAQSLAVEGAHVEAEVSGRATGWVDTLAIAGPAQLKVSAATARGPDIATRAAAGSFKGDVRWSKGDWRVSGVGEGRLQGSWSGLGPVRRDDLPELAALKRAAADVSLSAPAVAISLDESGARFELARPIRALSRTGVRLQIARDGRRALFENGEGAFAADIQGGGAPAVSVAASRYRLDKGGFEAEATTLFKGALGPARDAVLQSRGRLSVREGHVTYLAQGCIPLSVSRLELGENDVEQISGRLCQVGPALFRMTPAGWRLDARVDDAQALAPFFEARAERAAVELSVHGAADDVSATAHVSAVRLVDLSKATRFHPVIGRGDFVLAKERWTGDLTISDPSDRKLAKVDLVQAPDGRGGLHVDTGELVFAEGGLQPSAVSPMASPLGGPVAGQARFVGDVSWTPTSMTSSGRLVTPKLDFKSVAGPVVGLKGDIHFTSLAPLETAPGQRLTVERIDSMAQVAKVALEFQLAPDALKVADGVVELGGGRLRIEPFAAPLDGRAFEGVVLVENVQLKEIVARSPFGERVSVDAVVTGRLPFVLGPQGVRFVEGALEAVRPGTLSIRREALDRVAASGGQANAPAQAAGETNTVTEFAFQAMEHLAFESLSAKVNSLPGGRLGVLFSIKGAYEPPQEQSLTLKLGDLIAKDLMTRRLPLPSHTKVNLTLDSTLNLDQLLQDFARTQRAGSAAVQP